MLQGKPMILNIQLEPAAQAFAAATAQPPFLFELGPTRGRAALDALQALPMQQLPVDSEDLTVVGGPSGKVALRILRPQGSPAILPVIVYIHGGGWVFGNAHTHDRLVGELAVGSAAAVVFPQYSLSPEAKYPTAVEECCAALQWIADHGAAHGLDAGRIAIAGDGVGGTMAAVVTLLARERGGPPIERQLLFYPAAKASFDTASYHEFAAGYGLRRDTMMWCWDQYTTNQEERAQLTASPLRASLEQLQGLPPALIITAEADVLRDEGEAYAARLRAAGVCVMAVRFMGTIHDFVLLNSLANTAAARGAVALATAWLREGLAADAPPAEPDPKQPD
jgi:acetyl esterase